MKNLLITPSLYSLFLYTLIDNSWMHSDYVLSLRIPKLIHDNLRKIGANVYSVPISHNNVFCKIIQENIEYIKYLKYSRNKFYDKIFGNDEFHLSYKYRDKGIEIIEDGPFNSESKVFFKRRILKQDLYLLNYWFYWLWRKYIPYGYDKKVEKIWHTENIKLNKEIEEKGVVFNLNEAWNCKSISQKESILSLFSLDKSMMENINRYENVLVTQILPIPDSDKIKIYKNMLVGVDEKSLLIKTHYAENTNYRKFFPQAKIIDTPVPFQLFELLNYSPSHLFTISSSAVFPFMKADTKITFLGTEIDERIKNAYGIIRYEDLKK